MRGGASNQAAIAGHTQGQGAAALEWTRQGGCRGARRRRPDPCASTQNVDAARLGATLDETHHRWRGVRLLDRAGIRIEYAKVRAAAARARALGDHDGGLEDMRRNIDAWVARVLAGEVEAIVSSASAAVWQSRSTGTPLSGDAKYAESSARISALARDLSELLPDLVPR